MPARRIQAADLTGVSDTTLETAITMAAEEALRGVDMAEEIPAGIHTAAHEEIRMVLREVHMVPRGRDHER